MDLSYTDAVRRTVLAQEAAESGGWSVSAEKDGAPTLHATKDEALEAARARAREHTPSRLEVFKRDGTLQDALSF